MSDRESMPTKDLSRSCGTLRSKIPGVFSVNVSTDSLGDISDIHILATTRRNAKQISRDVQSALAAAFKLEIDHRIISIAQIESDTYAGVDCRDRNAEIRLRYTGMNVSMRSGKRTYQVRLARDEEEFLGESECANAPRQKRRAIAEATIQALETALNEIVADTPIRFEQGGTDLTPESEDVLDRLAALGMSIDGVAIVVEGHTDGDGSPARNAQLSQARADAVRDALIVRGLDEATLSAEGLGSQERIFVDGREDKEASRRVEFRVTVIG